MSRYGLVVGCLLLVIPGTVHAWGEHKYHAREVRRLLEEHLRRDGGRAFFLSEHWDRFVESYAYYPDWGSGGQGDRPEVGWKTFQEQQRRLGFIDTHDKRATLHYFLLLLKAFEAGDTEAAAVWAGCLSHVIGDAAAANHPPLLSYLTYGYGPMGMMIATSGQPISKHLGLLDTVGPALDPIGRQAIDQGLRSYKPKLLGATPLDAAVRLQLLLQEGWVAALEEDAPIAAGLGDSIARHEAAGHRQLITSMARLMVRCTIDTADAIYTAFQLAQGGKTTFDLPTVMAKAAPLEAAYRRGQPFATASMHADLLTLPAVKAKRNAPTVGVLSAVPPIYWVTAGAIDLQFCYFQSIVARTLRSQGLACTLYDVRDVPEQAFDPEQTSILVLPPLRSADGVDAPALLQRIDNYLERGGRILQVGGRPSDMPKGFSQSLVRSEEGDGYYPLLPARLVEQTVILPRQPGEAPLTHPVRRIMADFSTRATGNLVLKSGTEGSVKPLIFLKDRKTGEELAVAIGTYARDKLNTVYVPWYLFMPGVLDASDQLADLSRPVLGTESARVLQELIARLAQESSGSRSLRETPPDAPPRDERKGEDGWINTGWRALAVLFVVAVLGLIVMRRTGRSKRG